MYTLKTYDSYTSPHFGEFATEISLYCVGGVVENRVERVKATLILAMTPSMLSDWRKKFNFFWYVMNIPSLPLSVVENDFGFRHMYTLRAAAGELFIKK